MPTRQIESPSIINPATADSTGQLAPDRIEPPVAVPVTAPATEISGRQFTMLARRYELKYRIPESMATAIRAYISGYMEPDNYSARQPDGKYTICSIYLDSPGLNLFRETYQDKCNRFKLRIRGYDDNPENPVFFEIKRKLNRVVYKSRARAAKDRIGAILAGDIPSGCCEKDHNALQQFFHYATMLQAHPIALVRYRREAFECDSESRVRITFDRELCCRKAHGAEFTTSGPGWTPLPIQFVVLEIKFSEHYPAWLHHMVQFFNLNRQSMSKYCTTVQHLTQSGLCNPQCGC